MSVFVEAAPTPETDWRAIVLFGRNVATFKFALGRALLELADREATFVRLDELAEPYSRHLCAHLERADKQGTSAGSKFLDTCRSFNQGQVSRDELIGATVKLGFNNVIDAFHVLHFGDVGTRFFTDDRTSRVRGVTVTDALLALKEGYQWQNLTGEVEARWRLVETAWSLRVAPSMLKIEHDPAAETLSVAASRMRRVAITSSRDALNGYQKGRCFYCFRDISVLGGSPDLADVDHFMPHILKAAGFNLVDGIWNLVLACRTCNRGPQGKSDRIPEPRFLERLHRRNTYLVTSHHPLRETIMNQTGRTETERRDFLQRFYYDVTELLPARWHPPIELEAVF